MGPLGLEGLSEIAGMDISVGSYDMQEENTIIEAEGQKNGVIWQVWGVWRNGNIQSLWFHSPMIKI